MTDGEFNAEIFPEQGNVRCSGAGALRRHETEEYQSLLVALECAARRQASPAILRHRQRTITFEPETAAELTEAYRKIATSISDLRISQ